MAIEKPLDNPASSLEVLTAFAEQDRLDAPETYFALLEKATNVLANSGSFIQLLDLPTLIIPDLHARRGLLIDLLKTNLREGPYAGSQVFELLQQGKINIVCVGDIVHSENRHDWVINLEGEWTEELLNREMVRSLGAGAMIMYLKLCYPDYFHCLRGNHDDIESELGAYRKYVGVQRDEKDDLVFVDGKPVLTGDKGEPELVRYWILDRQEWGQPFLEAWAQFERKLPLLAQGSYYFISHTLPKKGISETDLRDPERRLDVMSELTVRRGIDEAAIMETLDNFRLKDTVERWFYGHTPVSPEKNGRKYEEDLNGLTVRLNNPERYVFAYVPASNEERRFEPTQDVYIKTPTEETFHL